MTLQSTRIGIATLTVLGLATLATYALARTGHSQASRAQVAPTAEAVPHPTSSPAPELRPNAAGPKPEATPLALVEGEIRVQARLDRDAVLQRSDGRVHVELSLASTASDEGTAVARPSDVLVVLDTSGSMMGPKLESAKRALHRLVDRMGVEDRLGLVTFHSGAQLQSPLVSVTDGSRKRLHQLVDSVSAGGGTDMTSGMALAARHLPRTLGARSSRVLVLSDGLVDGGAGAVPELRSRVRSMVHGEHVVSTMGIGDDFNEDLMTLLADTGTGNFYYLSRIEMIARFVDAELRAAEQAVARALVLDFDPAPGVRVERVGGFPLETQGTTVRVRPGSLYRGQQRSLWVTLHVPTTELRDLPLGKLSVRYTQDGERRALAPLGLPSVACVGDPEAFQAAVHQDLWERVVQEEYFNQAQVSLGHAIQQGSAADVDREVAKFESNRALANALGSTSVLRKLDEMHSEAKQAKRVQKQSYEERQKSAKRRKAMGYFESRASQFNDDPLLGL